MLVTSQSAGMCADGVLIGRHPTPQSAPSRGSLGLFVRAGFLIVLLNFFIAPRSDWSGLPFLST